jgi:hypothetical protein
MSLSQIAILSKQASIRRHEMFFGEHNFAGQRYLQIRWHGPAELDRVELYLTPKAE